MGSGKSTYAINEIINKNIDKDRFLCILPTLDECERYKKEIDADMIDPECWGTKLKHLQHLISIGKNIVTTHALIQKIDEVTLELLISGEYTLIVDECLDVFHKYEIKKIDIETLFRCNYVSIDDKGFLLWNNDEYGAYDGRFLDVKRLCNLNSLMGFKTIKGEVAQILMWNFPVDFFKCFEEIHIFTYCWNGSIQKCYFDLHNIEYLHKSLYKNKLVQYNEKIEYEQKAEIRQLISVYEGSLNNIGMKIGKTNPLCKNWYINQSRVEGKPLIKLLKKNVENYFRNITNTGSNDNMYTTFKSFEANIKGKRYTKGFVPCNSKGTNDYRNKKVLVYSINLFLNDDIVKFFKANNIIINQDLFSLCELLQWIWRSQIREKIPIQIYIPSERMRNLLYTWLGIL